MFCSARLTLKSMHRFDERMLLQPMDLKGTEHTSGVEEESQMELCKNDVTGLSQVSPSVMRGEVSRPPVHRRRAGWTIRMRGIDCALADIQAQIERLQQERTYLRLVQGELAGIEHK